MMSTRYGLALGSLIAVFVLFASPYSAGATSCNFGTDIGGGLCRGFLTAAAGSGNQTWSVPSDWNNSNNTVECIGAGGHGVNGAVNTNSGGGGGGGAYASVSNVTLTSGGTAIYAISASVDSSTTVSLTDTYFNGSASTTATLSCASGKSGSTTTAGAGGKTADSTGSTKYAGAAGGNGAAGSGRRGGGGGGGSAGPSGIGRAGGAAVSRSAGGGGGSSGGSSTVGANSISTAGGNGGDGTSGTGHGIGGSSGVSSTAGTSGGGGGGGFAGGATAEATGQNGGVDATFDSTHGVSGGGGGGTGDVGFVSRVGGNGGTYGGGGGGGAGGSSDASTGGAGGQGLIAITYAPIVLPDLTISVDTPPVTVPVGSAHTFTATIKNIGSASATNGYLDSIFQFDTDANHDTLYATTTVVTSSPDIGAGETLDISSSFSFTSGPGTYYVRTCTDENTNMLGVIAESNENNNCGNWVAITVTGSIAPDLTYVNPGTVSPTAASVGVSTPFRMEIKNNGTDTTGSAFTNAFQKATDASGTGATYVATNTAGPLAGGASTSGFSISYTFPAGDAGTTKYVRVCADRDVNGVGTIAEVNETDASNCGPWTAVAVTAPAGCSTFSVSPAQVQLGNPVTISWSCEHVTSCAEVPNGYGFTAGGATSGSDTATPTTTGTWQYGLDCPGTDGSPDNYFYTNFFDVVSPNATITSSPPVINAGDTPTITAACTGIPGGTAEVDGPSSLYPPSGVVTGPTVVDASGSYLYTFTAPVLSTQATYFAVCTPSDSLGGADAEVDAHVTVKFKSGFSDF